MVMLLLEVTSVALAALATHSNVVSAIEVSLAASLTMVEKMPDVTLASTLTVLLALLVHATPFSVESVTVDLHAASLTKRVLVLPQRDVLVVCATLTSVASATVVM